MNFQDFSLAFWHPFGPHGRETREQIIDRKQREIQANGGWTLWSFQRRRPEMLEMWRCKLSAGKPGKVFVFCSDSPNAKDPAQNGKQVKPVNCQWYQHVGQDNWDPIPELIQVRHPFNSGPRLATAFVVRQICHPVVLPELPKIEWLDRYGNWRQERLPSRGEYLIRLGGSYHMRRVFAVIELTEPYIVVVRPDTAPSP
jgi:hypothetical protein